MRRWVALLVAIVGGAIAAYTATLLAGGALMGFLWIYVFGDDPWPGWAMTAIELLLPLGGLILWAVFGWLIWSRLTAHRPAG